MSRGASATSTRSVQDAKKELQQFLRKVDTVPVGVLQEEAQTLYSEIILEVPYETGVLERSVRVSVAKDKRRPGLNASASARSKAGYNYAGIQHEVPFDHVKQSAKDHYISDPFKRSVQRIKQKIGERLKVKNKNG